MQIKTNNLYYIREDLYFKHDDVLKAPAVAICKGTKDVTEPTEEYNFYVLYSIEKVYEGTTWYLYEDNVAPFDKFLKSNKYNNSISRTIIKNLF
jgi:hypothetical protein